MADDIILCIGGLLFFTVVPMIFIFTEMRSRSKYPIRADVTYELGGRGINKKTDTYEDRIGYVDMKNEKGENSGAKCWRLQKTGKIVPNFDYSYVGEKRVFNGMKKAPHCHIYAVMGEKGEEFKPVKFISGASEYRPVYEGDRGMILAQIWKDIQSRNKIENWFKANIMQLAISGLMLITIIVLFLIVLQLSDIAKVLGSATSSASTCVEAVNLAKNASAASVYNPANNTLAGIPFGIPLPK